MPLSPIGALRGLERGRGWVIMEGPKAFRSKSATLAGDNLRDLAWGFPWGGRNRSWLGQNIGRNWDLVKTLFKG